MNQTGPKGVTADDVFNAIQDHLAEKGYAPSVRKIGQMVGLSSTSSVHHHLCALVASGRVQKEPGMPRAIRLIGETE